MNSFSPWFRVEPFDSAAQVARVPAQIITMLHISSSCCLRHWPHLLSPLRNPWQHIWTSTIPRMVEERSWNLWKAGRVWWTSHWPWCCPWNARCETWEWAERLAQLRLLGQLLHFAQEMEPLLQSVCTLKKWKIKTKNSKTNNKSKKLKTRYFFEKKKEIKVRKKKKTIHTHTRTRLHTTPTPTTTHPRRRPRNEHAHTHTHNHNTQQHSTAHHTQIQHHTERERQWKKTEKEWERKMKEKKRDKTRQDKTRDKRQETRDKRQETRDKRQETRQDRTGQDKTGQDRTRQYSWRPSKRYIVPLCRLPAFVSNFSPLWHSEQCTENHMVSTPFQTILHQKVQSKEISHVKSGTIFFFICSISAISAPLAAPRISARKAAPQWRRGCKINKKKKSVVSKSRPAAMNLSSFVATSFSTASSPIASESQGMPTASGKPDSRVKIKLIRRSVDFSSATTGCIPWRVNGKAAGKTVASRRRGFRRLRQSWGRDLVLQRITSNGRTRCPKQ